MVAFASATIRTGLSNFLDLAEKKSFIQRMFADILPVYDRCNRILSLGLDQSWRRKAVADLPANSLVVDLCAGTGDMAKALFKRSDFKGAVVLTDFVYEALLVAREKLKRAKFVERIFFVVADAECLPFKARVFNGAMMGFALRNLSDTGACFQETQRILSAQGVTAFLELAHPENRLWAGLFYFYFYRLSPLLARLFTRRVYAYQYLPRSLAVFPKQSDVVAVIKRAGFSQVIYRKFFGGAVAVYQFGK